MVLEAEVAHARRVLVGRLELVIGPIRVLAGLGPLIQVHVDDVLAVEIDVNLLHLKIINPCSLKGFQKRSIGSAT